MSLLVDEGLTLALGFSTPNRDYLLVTHLRGFLAHLVFGLTVAAVTETGWTLFRRRPSPTPRHPQLAGHEPRKGHTAVTMSEQFDAIVIGMGPGGEVAASRLLAAGKTVAVIEKELIGGECAYWACMPSKTLLRGAEAVAEATRAAGATAPELDWPALRDYRDWMIRHLDDTGQIHSYEETGATVIKAAASITGPGTVEAGGRTLTSGHVILATGSEPGRPPVDGLDQVTVWTNREATTVRDIPNRVLMLGGSAVGVELGQFYARAGAQVTIVQRGCELIDREDPRVGQLTRTAMEADGVTVHTARTVTCARPDGVGAVVTLDDGTDIPTDVIVLGTGRRPRAADIGVEAAGGRLDGRGAVVIDAQCRAGDGLWALGDVTGVALFTHVAKYQARIVTDNILGTARSANYHGIPRVVFADPEIAAVGLTTDRARAQGLDIATAEINLADAIARPWTYERDPRGSLGLIADREAGILVGAWAVAPLAGEWIHQAALAIRARIPIDTLRDQVAQFPTYAEGYLAALDALTGYS